MRLAAVVLVCLLAASCGGEREPDVDWSEVPTNQHQAIVDAVKSGDCERMQTFFDGSKHSDVLTYLDWHMKQADCY